MSFYLNPSIIWHITCTPFLCCFSEAPITDGRCISSFSFTDETESSSKESEQQTLLQNSHTDPQNISEKSHASNYISQSDKTSNLNDFSSKPLIHNKKLINNITTKVNYGSVPPINGEAADIRRSYSLRHSTVKKIDEIKNAHPEVCVSVSTIVDMAISHYYDCIFLSSNNN